MIISTVNKSNFSSALALMKKSGLPTGDVTNHTHLFVVEDEGRTMGTVGLEYEGEVGLLRSLCVDEKMRNRGYGPQLVGYIERFCEQHGVKQIYLLTTSAERFFQRRGFYMTKPEELPPFIKNSSEFQTVCPENALLMKKELE